MARPQPKEISAPRGVTHVALLRGINVGGKNMLPMPELAKLFERAGCTEVRTYIQSGNVLFSTSPDATKTLATTIPALIERKRGIRPALIIRSETELKKVVSNNPFPDRAEHPKLLHVGFLGAKPGSSLINSLDPDRSPGDRFCVRGSEIYLSVPNGVLKTKFTGPYFDSTLKTTSTWRNWRTVVTLLEMMRDSNPSG